MAITGSESDENAQENKGPVVIAVAIVMIALAILLIGSRLWSRWSIKALGKDDLTAVIALFFIIGTSASIMAMTQYGHGQHIWTLSDDILVLYFRAFWISILFYLQGIYWIKVTILLHYHRIMGKIALRWVCVTAIVLITTWCITQTVMALVQCIPIQAVWDHGIDGKCIPNQPTLWYIHGVVHIVSDFIIILMPLPIIWKLQLPSSQKAFLFSIFSLGFFNIAVSVLRLQWLTPSKDFTWWNATPASWSLAEMVSGLACACLPTLKPLLYRAKTWFPRTRFGDSTICLQDDGCDRNIELNTTIIGGKDTSSDRRTQPSMDADENERNTR
ncbi:hypothetical protein FCULG_00012684 [Fusarium culmorum]|uniref:Rhodopsin domain-containing protein n=1 Tax=Fusarium culmorum TaxID=5516 RepID=A0A2T4GCB9_FUSCU|nr:hypothetical protein FCULG_00012684 [Fusarium culmorum]